MYVAFRNIYLGFCYGLAVELYINFNTCPRQVHWVKWGTLEENIACWTETITMRDLSTEFIKYILGKVSNEGR